MKNFGVWLAKLISWVIWWLPASWCRALARCLAFLWWDVFRLRRFTVFRNLSIAFPELSKEEKIHLARESLVALSLSFLDFLMIPRLSPRYVKRHFILEDIENFERARMKGRGVLFLTLHLGSGDAAAAALSLIGLKIHLISKRFKAKWINDFWFGVRESKGTRFIAPHGKRTPFEILKALGDDENVIFVLDQFMGRPFGIETHFFGRKTGTAYGLALFAIKTRAPVVPIYNYRGADGKMRIVFLPEVPLLEIENRDLQILEMTESYNRVLESVIRRHPDQWMWVHRRWKMWE